MNGPSEELARAQQIDRLLLAGTLAMTFLTVAKELVLFQNSTSFVPFLVYRVAMRAYYPLLMANFSALLLAAFYKSKRLSKRSLYLRLAWVVFSLNVLLFSANNVLNILEGKPVHRRHQGIGW